MRRLLLGLLVGALIFGVSFAGAKVATVTNPMTANLDGGGYQITNVSDLETTRDIFTRDVDARYLNVRGGFMQLWPPGTNSEPFQIIASLDGDPSVAPGVGSFLGSLYISKTGLWRKTGPGATDWTRLG